PQLEDETGRQIDADAAMVFTLARHGIDQAVEVFMALRGGALECQIFHHCKPGRRQDGMGTHEALRSDRSATGGTQHDSGCLCRTQEDARTRATMQGEIASHSRPYRESLWGRWGLPRKLRPTWD